MFGQSFLVNIFRNSPYMLAYSGLSFASKTTAFGFE